MPMNFPYRFLRLSNYFHKTEHCELQDISETDDELEFEEAELTVCNIQKLVFEKHFPRYILQFVVAAQPPLTPF